MIPSTEALTVLAEEAKEHPNARISAVVHRLRKRTMTEALRAEAMINAAAEECARIAEENVRQEISDG